MTTRRPEQEERTPAQKTPAHLLRSLPILADDLPVTYEDEGQDEMGESRSHTGADHVISLALEEHLVTDPRHAVLSNLNLYYHPIDRRAYVSPDVMVVQTVQPLPERLSSYRIGPDRPVPKLVIEILSKRSFQQQDLTAKPIIYAGLGVEEYILVDGTGEFLSDRLLLKRLDANFDWEDEQDRDGGVTSRLGFRILIEGDELPRVIHAATGMKYLRPNEAHQAVRAAHAAQQQLEDRIRELEAELKRLTGQPPGAGDKP